MFLTTISKTSGASSGISSCTTATVQGHNFAAYRGVAARRGAWNFNGGAHPATIARKLVYLLDSSDVLALIRMICVIISLPAHPLQVTMKMTSFTTVMPSSFVTLVPTEFKQGYCKVPYWKLSTQTAFPLLVYILKRMDPLQVLKLMAMIRMMMTMMSNFLLSAMWVAASQDLRTTRSNIKPQGFREKIMDIEELTAPQFSAQAIIVGNASLAQRKSSVEAHPPGQDIRTASSNPLLYNHLRNISNPYAEDEGDTQQPEVLSDQNEDDYRSVEGTQLFLDAYTTKQRNAMQQQTPAFPRRSSSPIDVAGADTDNTVNEFLDQMNFSFFAQMSVSLIMCTLSSTRVVKQEVLINPIAEDRGIVTALKSKLPLKHYKVSSPTFQALLTGRLEWDEYRLRLLWVVTTKTERHAGLASTANRYHIASFILRELHIEEMQTKAENLKLLLFKSRTRTMNKIDLVNKHYKQRTNDKGTFLTTHKTATHRDLQNFSKYQQELVAAAKAKGAGRYAFQAKDALPEAMSTYKAEDIPDHAPTLKKVKAALSIRPAIVTSINKGKGRAVEEAPKVLTKYMAPLQQYPGDGKSFYDKAARLWEITRPLVPGISEFGKDNKTLAGYCNLFDTSQLRSYIQGRVTEPAVCVCSNSLRLPTQRHEAFTGPLTHPSEWPKTIDQQITAHTEENFLPILAGICCLEATHYEVETTMLSEHFETHNPCCRRALDFAAQLVGLENHLDTEASSFPEVAQYAEQLTGYWNASEVSDDDLQGVRIRLVGDAVKLNAMVHDQIEIAQQANTLYTELDRAWETAAINAQIARTMYSKVLPDQSEEYTGKHCRLTRHEWYHHFQQLEHNLQILIVVEDSSLPLCQ
ncbi:hypothetical protein KCU98_g678, partial [Aureobasidium melanogenum]